MLTKLVWESKFFNRLIYTIKVEDFNTSLLKEKIKKKKFSLIQVKVNENNANKIKKLIEVGFKIESKSNTYEKKTKGKVNPYYRIASMNDYKNLQKISKNLFTYSRIKDKYFGYNAANQLYSHWIKKSILGQYDDCCLAISDNEKLINGFVTLKKINNLIKIGLFGINKYSQYKGYSSKLLQSINHYMEEKKVTKSIVTTQKDNIPANKIYLKNGHKFKETNVWLYLKK